MEKIYLKPDEYEEVIQAYKDKYNYDEMTDEEKSEFDEKLDNVVGVSEDEDNTDHADESEDRESVDNRNPDQMTSDQIKDELRDRYGYDDMTDEQKQWFDEKLDEVVDSGEEDDEPDQPEKVLKLTR